MMTIRNSQFQALADDLQRRSLSRHLREYLPDTCSALGDRELEAAIREAMRRAHEHRLTDAADVQYYVDVSFVLGHGFEHQPRYAWALQILNDVRSSHVPFRASWLFDRVGEQLSREASV